VEKDTGITPRLFGKRRHILELPLRTVEEEGKSGFAIIILEEIG
jgi:hypothetical protein